MHKTSKKVLDVLQGKAVNCGSLPDLGVVEEDDVLRRSAHAIFRGLRPNDK
jgi:hypothetical protein